LKPYVKPEVWDIITNPMVLNEEKFYHPKKPEEK